MGSDFPTTAGEVVLRYVTQHAGRLHAQADRVRAGDPTAIHEIRISARRLRSALTTYSSLFEPGAVDALREELRWLGTVLSEARDAQVMRERLDALVAHEPPELVVGPVLDRIDHELMKTFEAGRAHGLAALDSARFTRLLSALDEFASDPPLLAAASDPAEEALPKLLDHEIGVVADRVHDLEEAMEPDQRDRALHEVRKKAKRLRYAAESAQPALGKPARRLVKWATILQTELGLHQDAVVARQKLTAYAAQARLQGESGFTFGRLHALEEARADQAELAFRLAWSQPPRSARRKARSHRRRPRRDGE